jgi:hypothetical protein
MLRFSNHDDRQVLWEGNDTMRLRRITARRSSVHGKGLFALQPLAAGERLIECKGEVTSWRQAAGRQRSEIAILLITIIRIEQTGRDAPSHATSAADALSGHRRERRDAALEVALSLEKYAHYAREYVHRDMGLRACSGCLRRAGIRVREAGETGRSSGRV